MKSRNNEDQEFAKKNLNELYSHVEKLEGYNNQLLVKEGYYKELESQNEALLASLDDKEQKLNQYEEQRQSK